MKSRVSPTGSYLFRVQKKRDLRLTLIQPLLKINIKCKVIFLQHERHARDTDSTRTHCAKSDSREVVMKSCSGESLQSARPEAKSASAERGGGPPQE